MRVMGSSSVSLASRPESPVGSSNLATEDALGDAGRNRKRDDHRAGGLEEFPAFHLHNRLPLRHGLGGAFDRAHDRQMRAATALEAGERIADLGVGRARIFVEQRHRGHHPAVETVAALWYLLLNKSSLHLVRFFRRADAGERLVELVVNGRVADTRRVSADGQPHLLQFDAPIECSSWVALRQFPQLDL